MIIGGLSLCNHYDLDTPFCTLPPLYPINTMELALIYIFIAAVAYWVWRIRKKRQEQKEAAEFIRSRLPEIKGAVSEFSQLLSLTNGYFSNYQLQQWQSRYADIHELLMVLPEDTSLNTEEEIDSILTIRSYLQDGESLRSKFNSYFIAEELKTYDTFFSNIEGRALDLQQRTAIITDEDNNLDIAGAGSGKTTTIVGKVKYIIDRYKAKPEEILLISFTKNAASTLAERIGVKGVEARTFHKLGKDIIVACEARQPSIFDEAQFRPLIERIFRDLVKQPNYLHQLTEYFTNYLKPVKSAFDFKDQGEYIQYLKDQNFKTYKAQRTDRNRKLTYRLEVVKSIEECRIANFLLFNNVHYEYEYPYEVATVTENHRQYKLDFTIKQGDKKIYLEHFGITRDGRVPDWFSGADGQPPTEKYRSDIEWKRPVHQQHGTTLLKSYSYEMSEGDLFDNLSAKLQEAGITLKPKSEAEIWVLISELAPDETAHFSTLIQTSISLMKSNNHSISDLLQKYRSTHLQYFRERNIACQGIKLISAT